MTEFDAISEYRRLVMRSPRPSEEQMRTFAHHVSLDHSWYKHLPETGNGEPFFFWLDPHAHEVRAGTSRWHAGRASDRSGPTERE